MGHRELTLEERRQIEKMLIVKTPVSMIASRLGRHRSSIYSEIGRNRYEDAELPNLNGYFGLLAQKTSIERRRRRRKLIRMPELRSAVEDRLRAGWSPEQISGRLRHEGNPAYVCHEPDHRPPVAPAALCPAVDHLRSWPGFCFLERTRNRDGHRCLVL